MTRSRRSMVPMVLTYWMPCALAAAYTMAVGRWRLTWSSSPTADRERRCGSSVASWPGARRGSHRRRGRCRHPGPRRAALDAGRPVVTAALHDEQRRSRAAVRLRTIDEAVAAARQPLPQVPGSGLGVRRHVRPEVAPDHAPPALEVVALVIVVLGRDRIADDDDAALERSVRVRLLAAAGGLPCRQQRDGHGDHHTDAQDRSGHGVPPEKQEQNTFRTDRMFGKSPSHSG